MEAVKEFPKDLCQEIKERVRIPASKKTAVPEWQKYQLAIDHLNTILGNPDELACLQALFSTTGTGHLGLLTDWFDYWHELLHSYDFLLESPVFKRFKVNRYEMLERFDDWLSEYEEVSRISGVKPKEKILSWSEFMKCFHIRQISRYLAAFWIQGHGMQPKEARKLLEIFGLRTKASSEDLMSVVLPIPPRFEPQHTNLQLRSEPIKNNQLTSDEQILMLFQPVYNNNDMSVHHCEALIRLRQGGQLQLPNHFLWHQNNGRTLLLQGLEILADRAPYLASPVAINIQSADLLDSHFVQALQLILERLPDSQQLIIELECQQLMAHEEILLERMHRLYDHGCQFSIDNCGLGPLPSSSALEFFSLFKLHPSLLHESHQNIAAKYMLDELNHYAKNMGALTVAKRVDSPSLHQRQKKLGFDLAQGFYLAAPSLHLPEIKADRYAINNG